MYIPGNFGTKRLVQFPLYLQELKQVSFLLIFFYLKKLQITKKLKESTILNLPVGDILF